MKITKINQEGIDLIKSFEGFSDKPYLCPANVPTIGYGSTRYADGRKVKLSDAPITKQQAEELLRITLKQYELAVDAYCIDSLNQNQFNALTSFCYNLGHQALKKSTLLKKVNANPNDESIADEFMKWTRASNKILKGLVRRREAEKQMYFKK